MFAFFVTTLIFCQLSLLETTFSSFIGGKSEEMSTSELSGGARIRYIFQSIFVKSLEVRIVDISSHLACLRTC